MSPRFSPFEDTLWSRTARPATPRPTLTGETEAEICIVGGGYCGLSAALFLAGAGREVVLLEAQEIGFGGSGRNAGHCTPTFHHHSLDGIRRLLGARRGERLIALQTGAADRIAGIVADHGIDCEWVQDGYVMAAPTQAALPALRAKKESYNAAGQRTEMIAPEEVEARIGMRHQSGGWLHPGGAHLNPLGYSRGLADAAASKGARIHVRSPVTEAVREDGRWRIRTPGGHVTARKLILATGAYTEGGWPGLDRSFRILRVMVAATRPDPDLAKAAIPQNMTVHDGRGNILVYKRDAAGRIVASMFPRAFGGMERMRRLLTARLRFHHPVLPADLDWPVTWTGELDMQPRTIPRLWRLGADAVAVTGLSGRGVPTGAVVGQVLTDWVQEVAEDDLALPLEPLAAAPRHMSLSPRLALAGWEIRDRLRERRAGVARRP
ncbi:glycine/D-amino acid oxidase-like deaminating enzyme [Palleronia aestuarii]|uniref:Glycine/D-amino acid oxidase-like deaminating enzyme n=1 Tax=Palleronia aestuarii TaxID=568105 RepID=A0A2W7NEZ2_9RHOB|nr:FAD-dependent oxidoreductase [Palleronia aestuarii]PZX18768.1 glycine/D-amino acid oxidase-like deaminating enzyme [Palleronia aestuarii]